MEEGLVQEQYLKALDLLQTPSTDAHQEADALLAQLGLTWRLSDAVWAACYTPCLKTSPPTTKTSEHQAASFPLSGTSAKHCLSSCPKEFQLVNGPTEEQNQEQPFLNTPVIFAPPDDLQAGQQNTCNLKPGGRQDPAGHMSDLDPGHMSDAGHMSGLNPGRSPPSGAPSLLPASLLSALRAAFDPRRSPFWADHAYHDPDTPFFSYVHDLRQPPSNIVELAAQSMWEGLCRLWDVEVPWKLPGGYACPKLQPLSATAPMLPAPSSTTGAVDWQPYSKVMHVEWWAHTRPPDGFGHQLHFDCDETRLRKGAAGYRLVHPCLSSVVFLSGGEETGHDHIGAVNFAAENGICNTSSSARNMGTECSDRVDRGKGVSGPDVGPPTVVLDQWPGKGLVAPTPQIHLPHSRPAPAAPVAPQFHSLASKPAPAVTAAAGLDTALDDAALLRSTGTAEVHTGGARSIETEERGDMGCEGGRVPATVIAVGGAGSAEVEGRQYLAERCWIVHPQAGQVLLFPGNLLHGVLLHRPLGLMSTPTPSQTWPGGSDRSGEQDRRAPGCSCPDSCLSALEGDQPAKEQAQRTTLIFAWWAEQGPGENQQQQQQLQPQQQQQREICAQGDAPRAQALRPQQVPPTRAWLSRASQHAQRLVHRSCQHAAAKAGRAAAQGKRAQGEGAISSPSLYARENAGSREEACEGGSAKRQKLGRQGNEVVHGIERTEGAVEAGAHERRPEWSTSQAQTDVNRRSEDSSSSSSSSSGGCSGSSDSSSESDNSEETSSERDSSKETGSARLPISKGSLPRWCQHFIDLMLSIQSLPDASHTRPPAFWTLPPPISPAWSLVKSKGRSQEEMSLASLEAIPDLRFCIPRPTYFNELYPVEAKVGSASICGV